MEQQDSKFRTTPDRAVFFKSDVAIAETLLQAGANPNKKIDESGYSLLDLSKHKPTMHALLKQYGGEPGPRMAELYRMQAELERLRESGRRIVQDQMSCYGYRLFVMGKVTCIEILVSVR